MPRRVAPAALSLAGAAVMLARGLAAQSPHVQPPPPCASGAGVDGAAAAAPALDVVIAAFESAAGAAHLGSGLPANVAGRLRAVGSLTVYGGPPPRHWRPASAVDVAEMGREARARYVVTGDVAASGRELRVTARLFRAVDGALVWTGSYRRAADRALDVERELAVTLAGFLTRRIDRAAARRLTTARTRSPGAHDLLMRGDHLAGTYGTDSLGSALRAYRAATRADPAYARAFARSALAHAQALDAGWGTLRMRPHAVADSGLAAAARAVALDPADPEGWMARGRLLAVRTGADWGAVRAAFARAAAAAPGDARVPGAHGLALLGGGRFAAAEAELQRALRIDPGHAELLTALGRSRVYTRRYGAACAALNQAIRSNRYHGPAYAQRATARARLGEVRDAWSDAETADIVGAKRAGLAAAAVVDGVARDTARARSRTRGFARLARDPNRQPLAAGEVELPALALVSAGDPDAALQLLERVYPHGAAVLALLEHPTYDGVRGRPGYRLLLDRSRGTGSKP